MGKLSFTLGKETYTLADETLTRMRQAMGSTTTRERGFALLGNIENLMPGEEKIGGKEGMRIKVAGTKGFFHTHPDGTPELSANDWVHIILASGELNFPFLECSGAAGEVYCTTVDDINKLTIPKQPTDDELDELVQHLVKPYHFRLPLTPQASRGRQSDGGGNVVMAKKEPLYPHMPKRKAPLYPHVTRGQQPENEEEIYNVIASDFISELHTGGWKKQLSELTSGRYLLEVYWEPWLYESGRSEHWEKYFDNQKEAEAVYDSLTDIRKVRKLLTLLPMTILAKTEGDPISKYCCSQCGECAPAELLEEGHFLDRINWLRQHYEEKHQGMWGHVPSTIPTEDRHLLGWVNEPLPKDAY